MAKTSTTTKSKAVAVRGGNTSVSLQQSLKDRIKKDSGKGLSTDMSDNIVPLVYVLQAQSPQAQKKNPKYVPGAEEGALWLRNSSDPIVDGEEGFLFQPCFFWKGFVEWRPNREGFVARHASKPVGTERREVKDEKGNKVTREFTKDGNVIVESKEWAGWVLGRGAPMGYVLPCGGSNLSFSNELMTYLNQQLDDDGNKLPSWYNIVRVKTKYRTNDKGSWHMFDFSPEREIETEEEYVRGQRLHEAFSSGAKQAATDDAHADGDDGDDI